MITNKVTFAALAAITVALGFAVVPALTTSQAFAQDCPGCHGQGHVREPEPECVNTSSPSENADKEGECPGGSLNSPSKQEETEVDRGKSGKPKGIDVEEGRK
jgi:Ribonuclease G/E